MGNLHHKVFPIMRKRFIGLSEFIIEHHGVCKGYTLGKHAKDDFLGSEHRSKEILDLVHSDVCGPMLVASISRGL
jgi:hypothetical protein